MIPTKIQQAFIAALGSEACLFDPGLLPAYSGDNSKRTELPSAVFFPKTPSDVTKIVCLCREHSLPITARGLGSGTPGGAVPVKNGAVVAFTKMNRVIEFSPENCTITVEPGVTNEEVQQLAAKHQLFWPPNPSSQSYATIGGNLAYNSAGPSAVKYGSCRDYVLGLSAVSGDGRELKAGCKTTKGVVGYDLTRLLIGSEGTLALITSATLKLLPQIKKRLTIKAFFKTAQNACEAITNLLQQPETPVALEMMDSNGIKLIESQGLEVPTDARALLMIEFEIQQFLDANALENEVRQRLLHCGAFLLDATCDPGERERLWALRKALSPAQRNVAPDKINEDVVVPIGRLSELMSFTSQLNENLPIHVLCFGHAGNGNMHVNFLYDKNDSEQHQAARSALPELFEKTLALGGTLSGEHGVGLDKAPFIEDELGLETVQIMREIKKLFDPDLILNPDKMFKGEVA